MSGAAHHLPEALARFDHAAAQHEAPRVHQVSCVADAHPQRPGRDFQRFPGQVVSLGWEALEVAAWALGVGIGNAANLVNPQRFVLGGGVTLGLSSRRRTETKAGLRFWEVVRRIARQTALPEVHFDIVPAALGDDAPLWGGIALAEELLPPGGGLGLSSRRRIETNDH